MSFRPVAYVARHVQAFLGSLGRLARNPLATMLTLVVIALALALPLGLKIFVTNARAATGDFANALDISVYLRTDVSLEKAEQLARSARERPDVAEVTLIPADQALAEFREHSGFAAALQVLQENPLPHVLHVRPTRESSSPAAIETLRRYFAAWPEVEIVQLDTEWVLRFNAILELLRRFLAIAALVLAVGVLAVVGNTIRLEILNRRAEIEVTKLVGGSNAFVRRPFLYTGALYGLGGALLALGIVVAAVVALEGPVATLAQSYGSEYTLTGPAREDVGALLAGGVLLGWIGAWIAAARHLRDIEPRA
ncbi:MAG: permease-like cell division protein FtsX [Pseudomonadota bacterium]|jgi:Cell division protein|nr:MAG: cell division protein [Pseudomonadota bacterium]